MSHRTGRLAELFWGSGTIKTFNEYRSEDFFLHGKRSFFTCLLILLLFFLCGTNRVVNGYESMGLAAA